MTDKNKEVVPYNLSPGKRKSAVRKDGILNTRVAVEERSCREGV